MIKFIEDGDIFENAPDVWLVNPVNCVGVMGAGLAAKFKKLFPENFAAYKRVCDNKQMTLDFMFIYPSQRIINFPTKFHWKDESKLSHIAAGLMDLFRSISIFQMEEVAVPALGCGLGGLHWPDVKGLIQKTHDFWKMQDKVDLIVYEPKDA